MLKKNKWDISTLARVLPIEIYEAFQKGIPTHNFTLLRSFG
jgi:hypothetical protein